MSYIEKIINKHQSKEIDFMAEFLVINPIIEDIKSWAGTCLQEVTYSGSYAKGTAIDSTSDLDLFISLKSTTSNTLKELYNSLTSTFQNKGYTLRKQNVSIRITKNEYEIDLVPAKNDSGNTNFHKLYSSKKDSWIKTNVKKHIDIVKKSNRIKEITALKVWRNNHGLSIPSLMIELMVIEGLKNKSIGDLDNNVLIMLEYLRDNMETRRIVDPSNTNNVISESMSVSEKKSVATIAGKCRKMKNWNDILW